MIAPNSLVYQKEGAQGEEEKEAGGRRKGRRERSQRSNSVRGVVCKEQKKTWTVVLGFHSTRGEKGAGDQSYPLTIGMEGATER